MAAVQVIAAKYGAAGDREHYLGFTTATNRFRFLVSRDGTASDSVDADILGLPAINTWYLVVAWHDSVADTINIEVNNGGVDSLPHATGVFDGTYPFRIGRLGALAFYMDGRIGPTMFWKSAPGVGGILTAAQRTQLWNGGTPLRHDQFTV